MSSASATQKDSFSRCFNDCKLELCILILICYLPSIYGQETAPKPTSFEFSGTSTLLGYYSNRQPFGQEIPPEYLNWHVRGQLNLWGVPLNVTSFLTTQQHPSRQSMNNFAVQLDTRSLLRRPDLSKHLPFLKYIETFEVGRTRPNYSQLMLHGIPLSGVNVAIRGFGFHVAFAHGSSLRSVNQGFYLQQQYKQKMNFGRLGFGKRNENFLNFSVLHAEDDASSINPTPSFYVRRPDTLVHHLDTFFIPLDSVPVNIKPRETLMSGLELGLSLFDHVLKLHAEVVGAVNTSNTQSESIPVSEIPTWVTNIHEPRLTTSVSWAYAFSSDLRLKTTQVHASMRRVAPGYHAPGTPFLRQDFLSYNFRLNQTFANRKLSVQPGFRWFRDNLSGMKAQTTYTLIWGVNATWRPVKYPYLSVMYSPHHQETRFESFNQTNEATVITVSTGKNYLISGRQAFTGLSWSHQLMSQVTAELDRDFKGNNFSLQQSLQFRQPLTFTTNLGYYHFAAPDLSTETYQFGLRANYQYQRIWNAGLGFRYVDQNAERKRTSITAQFNYTISKFGEIRFSAEPAIYRDLLQPEREYEEYVIRISLINKW